MKEGMECTILHNKCASPQVTEKNEKEKERDRDRVSSISTGVGRRMGIKGKPAKQGLHAYKTLANATANVNATSSVAF